MERLLEAALKKAEAATVYGVVRQTTDRVEFENGQLKTIESGMYSGTALTVVKNGRQGFAYTSNLIDRDGLVQDALAALAGGVEAAGPLPEPVSLPVLDTEAPQSGGNALLVEESRRIADFLSSRVKGQVNLTTGRDTNEVRLLTSSGVDCRARFTAYFAFASVLYPGSYAGIRRLITAKAFVPFPEPELQFIVDTYNSAQKPVRPVTGRTRVLFLPDAVYALVWRLAAASNAEYLYQRVSPLCDRAGEQLLSEKLTLVDQPLNDRLPGARAFDDEGTPCRDLVLFEKGVFRSFYNDRFYAYKTQTEPTGHGYRGTVMARPVPKLEHLTIVPGDKPLAELLRLMGTGVVVAGVLGAHSGNILNGDYSVGLAPGLWVEDGRIVGVVKDAMVAGNVYEDLRNVIAVGDTVQDGPMGRFPALLLDNVSFAARS